MSFEHTIGARLLSLKERAGMSLADIARAAGYQGASSIQKLFKTEYNPPKLQASVAQRLANAFADKGDPPIEAAEVVALSGQGEAIELLLADLKHYNYAASAFIGMHRTRRLQDVVHTENGDAVPLFVRQEAKDAIPFHPSPAYLRSRQIVGLYISVGNMWPRFEEGEPIFYEHGKPPAVGDDVVISLVNEQDLDGAMIVGRLRLIHDDELQIDILSPAGRVVLPRKSVTSVRRIMHATDFLEPISYARFD